ncbi:MAG: hypothetical protein M0Z60_01050 [Nitrospiraceae bacterium]|nr:hypothetical protein [Nitrospiraceae bacterium]
MILVLGLLPFFGLLISMLIIGNAGRNPREKVTLFFHSPRDADSDSASLLLYIRAAFWISLSLSAWLIAKTVGE